MRNVLLLFICFACKGVNAQVPFNTIDSITVNKLNASVLVHGDLWWNPATSQSQCTYAWSHRANVNFAAGLWMSAMDQAGQLHVSAQTYRQDGNDYWPGPLDANDTLTYPTSYRWAHIWKVNRWEIQAHQAQSSRNVTNTPHAILTWPAKGNPHALGNGGLALNVSSDMAPFVDVDGDGNYDALRGDYPDVRGDQALWWTFSDNGPAHNPSHGRSLGVEVHASSYAYSRGTPIDFVVYYEYDIVNKSSNNYSDFRLALFDDVDLGWYLDDFIGFDSARRLGICYNGTNNGGLGGGSPANSYGSAAAHCGVTIVRSPGDGGGNYTPAGSFVAFNNDASVIGNPANGVEFDNYMHCRRRDGLHLDFGRCGLGGSTRYSNYVLQMDPNDTSLKTECDCLHSPGDRRFVITTGGFSLAAGASAKVVLAFVVTDTTQAGCGGALNFDAIRMVSDTAWGIYHHPPPPIPLAVDKLSSHTIRVYPNPATDVLIIECRDANEVERVRVYNALGQEVNAPYEQAGGKLRLDVRQLPAGVYQLIPAGGNAAPVTFLKQ